MAEEKIQEPILEEKVRAGASAKGDQSAKSITVQLRLGNEELLLFKHPMTDTSKLNPYPQFIIDTTYRTASSSLRYYSVQHIYHYDVGSCEQETTNQGSKSLDMTKTGRILKRLCII